jgi:hypothetical protein
MPLGGRISDPLVLAKRGLRFEMRTAVQRTRFFQRKKPRPYERGFY